MIPLIPVATSIILFLLSILLQLNSIQTFPIFAINKCSHKLLYCSKVAPAEREWGQSFIGQDVCGSKYNDDPFTEQSEKPDSWEDMKRRIDALVELKLNSTSQKVPEPAKSNHEQSVKFNAKDDGVV